MQPILLGAIDDNIIPILAIGATAVVAIIAIFFGALRRIMHTTDTEKTRREIAAYVAEGSITPEEGERLLNAGPKDPTCGPNA